MNKVKRSRTKCIHQLNSVKNFKNTLTAHKDLKSGKKSKRKKEKSVAFFMHEQNIICTGNTYHCDVTVICVARDIRVPPLHISLVECALHISLVECVFIPSDMCSSTPDTHITSDSVLLRGKHISLVICVPLPGNTYP